MKMPFIKFYPRDWAADVGLRSCSYAARGLWIDLLSIMAMNYTHRGFLETASGGPIIDHRDIAKLTCGDAGEVERLLPELERAGVFSRDERGCIFSRRMVADAGRAERGRADGMKGGNPALLRKVVNPTLIPKVNSGGYPSGVSIGIYSEPRTQNPEESGFAAPAANAPKARPTTAQIMSQKSLVKMLDEKHEELKGQTCEDWQRRENPELVKERNRIKGELDQEKAKLLAMERQVTA